jgi:hypothetical protein
MVGGSRGWWCQGEGGFSRAGQNEDCRPPSLARFISILIYFVDIFHPHSSLYTSTPPPPLLGQSRPAHRLPVGALKRGAVRRCGRPGRAEKGGRG